MKPLTRTQFITKLRDRATAAGSQRALARALGITDQYLSDVLAARRAPGPKLLRALGYQAEARYIDAEP